MGVVMQRVQVQIRDTEIKANARDYINLWKENHIKFPFRHFNPQLHERYCLLYMNLIAASLAIVLIWNTWSGFESIKPALRPGWRLHSRCRFIEPYDEIIDQ